MTNVEPVWEGLEVVQSIVERVGPTNLTVLLLGETGTGKEEVAKSIHRMSRQGKPFLAKNCAAVPRELIESELFGCKRGAHSGAHADQKGVFEAADGGTVFLDEIGEASPELQAKLLRVLQDKTFQRVGDTKTITVNVRLIAATKRSLKEVGDRFREDLYHRLNTYPIELPPLRHRRTAIGILLDRFIATAAEENGLKVPDVFETDARQRLLDYDYPGNVRELRNFGCQIAVNANGADAVVMDHLPKVLKEPTAFELELEIGEREAVDFAGSHSGGHSEIVRQIPELQGRPTRFRQAAVALALQLQSEYLAFRRRIEEENASRRDSIPDSEWDSLCSCFASPCLLAKGLAIPQEWCGWEVVAFATAIVMRWDLAEHHADIDLQKRGNGGRGALARIYGTTGLRNPRNRFLELVLRLVMGQ